MAPVVHAGVFIKIGDITKKSKSEKGRRWADVDSIKSFTKQQSDGVITIIRELDKASPNFRDALDQGKIFESMKILDGSTRYMFVKVSVVGLRTIKGKDGRQMQEIDLKYGRMFQM